MPVTAPKLKFSSFPCSGVLNESISPGTSQVGGSGLTADMNLIYHRRGTWGKRPGSTQFSLPQGGQNTPVSGFRWYRMVPFPLTQLFIYSQNNMWSGNGIGSLTSLGQFPLNNATSTQAPMFCAARDPQADSGNGADVCIITGITLPGGSFGVGTMTITGNVGTAPSGVSVYATITNGASTPIVTSSYTILQTDTPSSIATQLALLINQSAAYINFGSGNAPFLGASYATAPNPTQVAMSPAVPTATVQLGAAIGGGSGNSITYSITLVGSTGSLAVSPSGTTNFTGGGVAWHGPCRYDNSVGGTPRIIGLSYMAPNAFTGCATWHNHVFFWGDPNDPDTVFACDINQPEAFTFMIQNGGMTGPQNGGYPIGRGDGDPGVQACVPTGNGLYIIKTSSIYLMEGYDFQQGEYQFNVSPQVYGEGIPAPNCVGVLDNALVMWTGRKFIRLTFGTYEPEHIGLPIPYSEGLASLGNQTVVRVITGDFQVQVGLNNSYGGVNTYGSSTTVLLRSLALFAVDFGDGNADTILVFDDEMTSLTQQYAWSHFTGWNIGCWILYGSGENAAGTGLDKPLLYWVGPNGNYINLFGGSAVNDAVTTSSPGNPIPWLAQTGWVDCKSPEILKNAHRLFINAEAGSGAKFQATLVPGRTIPNSGQVLPYSTNPQTLTYPPTIGATAGEASNDLVQNIEAAIQSKSVLMQFTESGVSGAAFEMLSWGLDIIEETIQP